MSLLYFFLSIFISLGAIVILRYSDRNNRSFEKIHKLTQKVKDEIDNYSRQSIEQLKNFDTNFDYSIKKGESLLKMLNDGVNNTSLKVSGSIDSSLKDRLAALEKAVDDNRQLLSEGNTPGGVSKNIKALLKESVKEVKFIRADIKKMQTEIDVEKKNISSMIENHNKDVGTRITNYRKELELFVSEQWKSYTKHSTEINTDIKRLDEKMDSLRGGHLEQFQSNLTEIEDTQRKKLVQMKDEFSKLHLDVQKDIEKKIGDYSTYFTRLENRVDEYTVKLEKKLEKEIDLRVLDINKAATDKVKEIDAHVDLVKTDARNSILKIVREYDDKIQSLVTKFKEMESATGDKIAEYEAFLSDSSINIENIRNDIFTKIEDKQKELSIHLNNAADLGMKLELKVFDNIKEQLRKFKISVDKTITDLDKNVSDKILSNNNILSDFDKLLSDKSAALNNDIKVLSDRISNVTDENSKFITKNSADIEALENEVELNKNGINAVLQELKDQTNYRVNEVSRDVELRIDEIKKHFNAGKEAAYKDIESMLHEITANADGKTEEINSKFNIKFVEIEKQLQAAHDGMITRAKELENDITGDSKKIRDDFLNKQIELEDKINIEIEKMREFVEEKNSGLYHEVSIFESKLKSVLSDFEDRIYDNEGELKRVEKEYFEKGELYLKKCEDDTEKLQLINERIKEEIQLVKNNIETDITALTDNGRNEARLVMENGKSRLLAVYKELESETDRKINEYKDHLSKIKHNMKLIEDKFDAQFEDKLVAMDKKFDGKQEMFNEKYKIHLSELTERTNSAESDFLQKLSGIESDFNKRTMQLLNDNKKELSELNKSYDNLQSEIEKIEKHIDQHVNDKIESGKNMLNEQYDNLETDSIRRINDYKNELLTVRQSIDAMNEKFDAKFNDTSINIDDRFKEKYIEINERYAENIALLRAKITDMETQFRSGFDNSIKSNTDKLNSFVNKFDNLSLQIETLKTRIDKEIADRVKKGVDTINSTLEERIENANKIFSDNETGFVEKLDEYKKDFVKIQQNMKQTDAKFTAQFIEHSSVLDKRIALIETEIKRFENHTKIFDKANNMKDKLDGEIKLLIDNVNVLKGHKADMDELEKKINKINTTVTATESKYTDILSGTKKIENIEATINDIKVFIDDAQKRIADMSDARVAMKNIETQLDRVESRYKGVETMLHGLDSKEASIKQTGENIGKLDHTAKDIEMKISNIARKLDEVRFKEETYEKSLKAFEKDASLILQSQDRVMSVIEKFNQMDSFIEDLEVRSNSINKHREWLVKAQTQMENLNAATDKKIKILESLVENEGVKKDTASSIKGDDSLKESVIKLKKQGWAIDDIAKTLNLSIGEVEFILDLEMNAKSR